MSDRVGIFFGVFVRILRHGSQENRSQAKSIYRLKYLFEG